MPTIKLPKYLNPESLYLYCELTAFSDGKPVDFTGLKTYSIGFMKENLGFGITDINIDISPSMQPIIEITFKDFYGNLAFGFNENQKIIDDANAGRNEIGELDFMSMFDLPYPKFRLTIKGFVGHPVVLELNVKKINVSLIPTDGSYEIKALFIPNLYGFFADMPYYFLKAVKSLRLDGASVEEKKEIEETYLSVWDIAQLGQEIQQEIQTIEEAFDDVSIMIEALLNNREKIFETDWLAYVMEGKTKAGVPIPKFQDLYFNIEPLANGAKNSKLDISSPITGSVTRKALGKSANREVVRRALIASLATDKKGKKYDVLTQPREADVQRGIALLENNKKILENFRNSQLKTGSETKIKNVTIKSVFDLMIRDTAFLLGKILEAGQRGKIADSQRGKSTSKFGEYYPLIQDSTTYDQIPDPSALENNFVNKFGKALTEGIVSDLNKGIENNDNTVGLNQISIIPKRINNLEFLSTNPYDTNNVNTFIESLLLRSGIVVSMNDESDGTSFNFSLKAFSDGFTNNNFEKLIEGELENADAGLKKISAGSNRFELLNFCNFISKIFDENGNLFDNSKKKVDLETTSITDILNLEYVFPNENSVKLGAMLNRYLPSTSGVNLQSYKSEALTHNRLPFFTRIKKTPKILYVIFQESTNTPVGVSFSNANEESTQAFPSDRFTIKEIKTADESSKSLGAESTTIGKIIEQKRLVDYDKLITNGASSQEIIDDDADIYFEQKNVNKLAAGKFYIGSLTTGANDVVWNLFGNDDTWVNQRKYLFEMCKSIKAQIDINQEATTKKVNDTIAKIESQYNVFYTQFHHICNNWKSLIDIDNISSSSNIAKSLEDLYSADKNGKVIYQIPLQEVQKSKKQYNLGNAIVNTKPLGDTNSQTTVLNIMASLCHLNNFMFISVPGNGLNDENIKEVFTPYDRPINSAKLPLNNFFYVMFMPTPENRIRHNNRDPLYQTFNVSLEKDVFEVDFGSVDNTIIKSINLTTEDNKVTAESAIAISNLVDGPNSRKAKNLDCSALSIMEGRSYKLNGEMIGNAQIVPTQFFIVNRSPIFNGLYQIMKVKHRITPNNMTTSFEAIKMKFAGNDSKAFVFVPPITLDDLLEQQDFVSSPSNSTGNNTNTTSTFVTSAFIAKFANDRYSYIKAKENAPLLNKPKTEYTKPFKDAKSFSIGYGHYLIDDIARGYLIIGNKKISMSEVNSKGITIAQCDELFKQDVAKFENALRKVIPGYDSLSENKKGALLSYKYNTGLVDKKIIKNVNDSNHLAAADSIKNGIITSQGQIFQPLVIRREEEAELYKFDIKSSISLI